MFWYGNGMGGWGYGLMAFSSVLVWALVIVAIVLVVRHFTRAGQPPGTFSQPSGPPGSPPQGVPPQVSPEQVLAERYARGEIDAEEFRERLATLREADQAGPRT